jgi:glycosyltransferase involved in cell wall biosynthesis
MIQTNVLHVLRSYSLHGGEKQIANSISRKHYKYNQFFLNFYLDQKVKKYFKKKHIKYYEISKIKIIPRGFFLEFAFTILLLITSFNRILKLIHKNKISIIVCHGFQASVYFYFHTFFLKKITFFYMHRIFKKKRIWDFFSHFIYRRFEIIIGNSVSVISSLKSIIKYRKIYLINNGVKYNKNIKFQEKNFNYLIAISRLEKRKDIPFLLDSFKIFKKNNPKYKFYIIGDGPEKFFLMNYVKENKINDVVFKGYLYNINSLLKDATIFVHASHLEGMSNAVLEAMNLGVPSVVVKAPGVSDGHVNNVSGFISKRDTLFFSRYLNILANNIKIRKLFFRNSRNIIKNKYNINLTSQVYFKLYDLFKKN